MYFTDNKSQKHDIIGCSYFVIWDDEGRPDHKQTTKIRITPTKNESSIVKMLQIQLRYYLGAYCHLKFIELFHIKLKSISLFKLEWLESIIYITICMFLRSRIRPALEKIYSQRIWRAILDPNYWSFDFFCLVFVVCFMQTGKWNFLYHIRFVKV